ncbi:hypothetical protein [Duganella callida]|uniref:Uncharacterized protein n=1 Tax=Duganella callida TaxID=2561932 RepID=A0A4Y9SMN7_9BURK|nr:hypothetical protein [Duganella callida]TFW25561.1 hypothetical protein E4L98_09080 [Duganella callida]
MKPLIASQPQAHPVFILPAALNACAEDAGRALVAALLRPGGVGAVGPAFVIDGDGLVDLVETITDAMDGQEDRGAATSAAPQLAALLTQPATSIIGEIRRRDGAQPAALYLEIDGAALSDMAALLSVASHGTGLLVRCGDFQCMANLAAMCVGTGAVYLHAAAEDALLARLLASIFPAAPGLLTISSRALPAGWPAI